MVTESELSCRRGRLPKTMNPIKDGIDRMAGCGARTGPAVVVGTPLMRGIGVRMSKMKNRF